MIADYYETKRLRSNKVRYVLFSLIFHAGCFSFERFPEPIVYHDSGASVALDAASKKDSGPSVVIDAGTELSLTICPENPRTTDDLIADFDGDCSTQNDPLFDPEKERLVWTLLTDGDKEFEQRTISSSDTVKHQSWQLALYPASQAATPLMLSPEVSIANSPPSVPTLVCVRDYYVQGQAMQMMLEYRSGDTARLDEVMRCWVEELAVDPDDDRVTHRLDLKLPHSSFGFPNAEWGQALGYDLSNGSDLVNGQEIVGSLTATDTDTISQGRTVVSSTIVLCSRRYVSFSEQDHQVELLGREALNLGAEGTIEFWALWNAEERDGDIYTRYQAGTSYVRVGMDIEGRIEADLVYQYAPNSRQINFKTNEHKLHPDSWAHVALTWDNGRGRYGRCN